MYIIFIQYKNTLSVIIQLIFSIQLSCYHESELKRSLKKINNGSVVLENEKLTE